MFTGSIVALITPMYKDGSIDYSTLNNLIELHIREGTDSIVILGSTGEASTIDLDEQISIVKSVVKQSAGRIPIIVGSNQNGTQKTIDVTKKFVELGVDACLLACPGYIKPTQEGLHAHFSKISSSVDIPLILYNIPGRTCCDLLPETVIELSKLPNIIGIKESSCKLQRVSQILDKCSSDFTLLAGEDKLALSMLQEGAKGVISVTANLAPILVKELIMNALAKKFDIAQTIDHKLSILYEKLFVETNPIPVKWAMNKLGIIDSGIRLPLTNLSPIYEDEVSRILSVDGLIKVI
ncbi:MAG: 4-hydroxy-tetrahydrodipicolinate synthase [Legionellales bacterium]|nr:4-hydroxy-tetrahydrodipicolinate synthase [Legionellales bacterium]